MRIRRGSRALLFLPALLLLVLAPAGIAGAAPVPAALATGVTPGAITSSIGVGDSYSCAIKIDGALACWGDDSRGQTDAPSGTFTQVSTSDTHACAIKTGGSVVCWGAYVDETLTPPGGTFQQVSVGHDHACGIRTGGSVTCWSANAFTGNSAGQLNAPGGTFKQIGAGSYYYNDACVKPPFSAANLDRCRGYAGLRHPLLLP